MLDEITYRNIAAIVSTVNAAFSVNLAIPTAQTPINDTVWIRFFADLARTLKTEL